jgi:hypothetical protein
MKLLILARVKEDKVVHKPCKYSWVWQFTKPITYPQNSLWRNKQQLASKSQAFIEWRNLQHIYHYYVLFHHRPRTWLDTSHHTSITVHKLHHTIPFITYKFWSLSTICRENILLEYSPSSKLLSVARTRNANKLGLNMKTSKCIYVTE